MRVCVRLVHTQFLSLRLYAFGTSCAYTLSTEYPTDARLPMMHARPAHNLAAIISSATSHRVAHQVRAYTRFTRFSTGFFSFSSALAAFFCARRYTKLLKRPRWNPPNWLFGAVWPVLYTAQSVASWLVWKNKGKQAP